MMEIVVAKGDFLSTVSMLNWVLILFSCQSGVVCIYSLRTWLSAFPLSTSNSNFPLTSANLCGAFLPSLCMEYLSAFSRTLAAIILVQLSHTGMWRGRRPITVRTLH